jgi:hypothetical protein
MQVSLIELQYLPCITYFSALSQADEIIIERHENYIKQSYRNRCYINTAGGVAALTLPVIQNEGKTLITDVRIDNSQKWFNNHWRTITSAYGNAPFFEYYADDLYQILFKKPTHLYGLNLDLLTLCLKWLKMPLQIKESNSYEKEPLPPVVDLRSTIHPKKEDNLNPFYKSTPYVQVFGNKFAGNLSLIDLIFCVGPGAHGYIQGLG